MKTYHSLHCVFDSHVIIMNIVLYHIWFVRCFGFCHYHDNLNSIYMQNRQPIFCVLSSLPINLILITLILNTEYFCTHRYAYINSPLLFSNSLVWCYQMKSGDFTRKTDLLSTFYSLILWFLREYFRSHMMFEPPCVRRRDLTLLYETVLRFESNEFLYMNLMLEKIQKTWMSMTRVALCFVKYIDREKDKNSCRSSIQISPLSEIPSECEENFDSLGSEIPWFSLPLFSPILKFCYCVFIGGEMNQKSVQIEYIQFIPASL